MKRFALVVLLAVMAGCASANGPLVLVEDSLHDSLAKADDKVRSTCSGPGATLLKPVCDDVRKTLIPTLETGAAFNRCIGNQVGGCLTPLVSAVDTLIQQVKKLPESDSRRIIEELARAVASAVMLVGRGGGQ